MLNTTALCMSRSKMAVAVSPKISHQSGSPRLVASRVGWPFFVAGVDGFEQRVGLEPDEDCVVDDEHCGGVVGLDLGGGVAVVVGAGEGLDHCVPGGELAAAAGFDGDEAGQELDVGPVLGAGLPVEGGEGPCGGV